MTKVTPEEAFKLLADKNTIESILKDSGQIGLKHTKEYFLGSLDGEHFIDEQGTVDVEDEKIKNAFTYAVDLGHVLLSLLKKSEEKC